MKFDDLIRAFVRGVSGTLGIAQVRRYVPTPEESLAEVRQEIAEAIKAVHDEV